MLIRKSRLLADIDRWQSAGWVTPAAATAIRTDLEKGSPRANWVSVFAILGAVLMGCAGISFVAANWSAMSKLSRLAVDGAGIAATYAAAAVLFRRQLDLFAHAAVLLGVALFGASIMLIAQMYHISGNPPDAVWLWASGALIAGILIRSNPALGAAIGLIATWSIMVTMQDVRAVHWGFLPMWAIAAAGVSVTRWRSGMHALALTLSGWLVISTLNSDTVRGPYVLLAIGLALAVLAALAHDAIDRWRKVSPTMLSHGIILAYIGLFTIQFPFNLWSTRIAADHLWIWGGVTLGLLCAAMVIGARFSNTQVLRLTYGLFTVEIFAIYVAKIGTLLGTSAFFLIAGALLLALAAIAFRLGLTQQKPKMEMAL